MGLAGSHMPAGGQAARGPGRDSGGPTCGGDAVEPHEGVEAGRGPGQDPREAEGQEAANAELPFRAAETEATAAVTTPARGPRDEPPGGSAWLVATAGPGDPRPLVHSPCGCHQAQHPGSGPQASCTLPRSLFRVLTRGSGPRALRGQGVRQEREGPAATAPPPGTRRRSPGFPGDSGLRRAFLETPKGELFVSKASLRPACAGGQMPPGWAGTRAGTQHSRAPGGHHALCRSGHKVRPIW